MANSQHRHWWVAPTVFLSCWVGCWWAEQAIFPASNGAIGGIVGFFGGAVIALYAEHFINRQFSTRRKPDATNKGETK